MSGALGREKVMAALRASGRAMHLVEIAKACDVAARERDTVRAVLDDLRSLGMVKEMPGNRFRVAPPRRHGKAAHSAAAPRRGGARVPTRAQPTDDEPTPPDAVAGWLSMTTRGFAFVAADDGGPDVFLPPRAMGSALHGDRVLVRTRRSPQGREGEVWKVVERGLLRVAGTLTRDRRALTIEPNDPRLPERFRVVGSLPLGAAPGMEVVGQIARYAEQEGELSEVRVLEVLGPRGSADTEIAKILIREGVSEERSADALAEALGFPPEVPAHDLEGREDMRHLALVTIDPEDARDHDDAVFAERLAGGGYRVVIAIADVSHYVREGSPIDVEARARGCTVYLPGRAIPMLPPELSTNLASLVPDEDRLFLGVEVELGARGSVKHHRFVEGVMRSPARLSYGMAARALGLVADGEVTRDAAAHLPMLRVLHEISRKLRAIRTRRGALGFTLPEAKVVLDERGEPADVVRARSDPGMREAYEIVEDLMLLANETVASELVRRRVPTVFRVHGKPDPAKVETFAAVASSFGVEVPEDAGASPKKLAAVLEKLEGTPHAASLSYLLLRAMQQATYQVENIGHFALAARDYLHFTSPIRRYPDLVVHRTVRAIVRGERIDGDSLVRSLREAALASSRAERRSVGVEREVVALYRALLVKDRVGEEFDGVIGGVAEHGLFVAIHSPWVELRVPIAQLGEDYYELDRLGTALRGRRSGHTFRMGDAIRVRLDAVSVERREITGSPVTHAPSAKPRRTGESRPSTKHARKKGAPTRAPQRGKRGKRR